MGAPVDLTRQLAHEIQAPLTSLELQLHKLREALPESDLAESCLEEIASLKRLVASFLELDALELQPRPGELAPVLRRIDERFRPIADAKQVALRIDSGSVRASFDARATERILANLVDNAIKFSSEAGRVDVRARVEDDAVEVEVKDRGIGIPTETQPLVFEPFYRASRETAGSGLGLAIAKRLAEAQQGSLHVKSEPGRGSSFVLTLPAG